MGNGSSAPVDFSKVSPAEAAETSKAAMNVARQNAATFRGGGVTGGGVTGGYFDAGYTGGEEDVMKTIVRDLRKYRDSDAARMKEDVIRGIAKALSSKDLGFKVDPDADLDEIVKAIRKEIPDPRKGNTMEIDEAGQQALACKTIAKALNAQFPQRGSNAKLIDVTASPESICRAVADLVKAMSSGIQMEFLEVHAGLENALRRLTALRGIAGEMRGIAFEKIGEGADGEKVREAQPFRDAFERLDADIERAIKEIEGFVGVSMAPAQVELESLLAEQGKLWERLKGDILPGSSEFRDSIAFALTSMGTLSNVAARANKALITLGLSLDDYVSASKEGSWTSLEEKIDALELKADPEKHGDFLKAAKELRASFGREGLAKAVEEQSEKLGRGEVTGGEDSAIDKRVKKKKAERKLILKQYLDRSQRAYNKLLAAIKVVGPKLGKEIPVSEQLDALRDAVERLSDMDMPRLDLSLIGFYSSAQARANRENFLNQMKLIQRAVEDIVATETYSSHSATMRPISEAIDDLVQTIDFYSKVVIQKYGGEPDGDEEAAAAAEPAAKPAAEPAAEPSGELAAAEPAPPAAADPDVGFEFMEEKTGEGEFVGGDEYEVEELAMAEQMRSSLDLKTAIFEFKYYFYVARVRDNLKVSAEEIQKYGEKYDSVLGDAVAARLKAIDDEKKEWLKEGVPADATHLGDKPAAAADVPLWEAAKAAITEEYDTKKEFYGLLQAVDLYMKAFAEGAAADPEAMMDIKKSLGGVNMVARWFTDETGNELAKFFDLSQAFGAAGAAAPPVGENHVDLAGKEHYYVAVFDALQNGHQVGTGGAVPARDGDRKLAEAMKKTMGKALNNFQALKNLLNAFARLASRLGGSELEKKTFMSVAQMYRTMIKFLRVSSISTRLDIADGAAPITANLGGNAINQGANPAGNAANARANAEKVYVTPARDNDALKNRWSVEMQYFQFIVKCIASKILTVIGVFDLFERPEPIYDLTPTRVIIGGYGDRPEVIPEATELYFRLPRLAEFYRTLFKFTPGQNVEISMLPEMEGTFSGLISVVFVKVQGSVVESGEYSDAECEMLVEAINRIYEKFRDDEKPVKKAISEFISEINRRYGLIKETDYDKVRAMQQDTRNRYDAAAAGLSDTNFAILPGEEQSFLSEGSRRLAPSDRYARAGDRKEDSEWIPGKYSMDTTFDGNSMWGKLKAFRENLSTKLTSQRGQEITRASYRGLLTQARRELDRESDKDKRLDIVLRLIQGSEYSVGTDASKLLMFHETVVAGLSTLTAITRQLQALRYAVDRIDIVEASKRVKAAMEANANPNRANLVGAPVLPEDFDQTLIISVANAVDAIFERDYFNLPLARGIPADFQAYITAQCGTGNPDDQEAAMRLFFNRPEVMRRLLLTILQLSTGFEGLVSVRFPGSSSSKVHLDFAKLRGLVEDLMADTRKYLNHFRGSMSADTIKRFESANEPGTMRWLEENLVDSFIRPATDDAGTVVEAARRSTMDGLSRRINEIFVDLTKRHAFRVPNDGGNNFDAAAAAVPTNDQTAYDQYGRILAGLVFWDTRAPVDPLAALNSGPFGGGIGRFILGPTQDPRNPNPALQSGNGNAVNQAAPTYQADGFTEFRSILFSFNQTLGQYLDQYHDAASGKIYQGLIDSFANGAFSQAVMSPGYSQPDVFEGAQAFGQRGDPTSQSVLLTSLATVLQRFTKDVNTQGVSRHLLASLAEVPLYMRESFREGLPIYVKMFETLNMQGEMLKQLIQRGDIQCGRSAAAAAGEPVVIPGVMNPINQWPAGSFVAGVTLRNMGDATDAAGGRASIINVIDGLSSGCYAMSRAAQSVHRELGDEPLYLQTSESSIQDYKSRYGKMPLMPVSLSMRFLRNLPNTDANGANATTTASALMPKKPVGGSEFKMLYGVRGLFAMKPVDSLSSMPGATEILKNYNSGVQPRDKISESDFGSFVVKLTTGIRYLVNLRAYRAGLTANMGTFGMCQLFEGMNDNVRPFPLRTGTTETQVLETVDSSFQEDAIQKFVDGLDTGNQRLGRSSREDERIRSLIDLGIPPINVHALMRSMAFANVYNFSYTFEEMACLYYGKNRNAVDTVDTNAAIGAPAYPKSTRDFFLKTMLDPYAEVSEPQYGLDTHERGSAGFVARISRGDNDLSMGRPKFISDQLWNKVLFGSLFQSQRQFDEGGPGTGAGAGRGRQGWGVEPGIDAPGPFAAVGIMSRLQNEFRPAAAGLAAAPPAEISNTDGAGLLTAATAAVTRARLGAALGRYTLLALDFTLVVAWPAGFEPSPAFAAAAQALRNLIGPPANNRSLAALSGIIGAPVGDEAAFRGRIRDSAEGQALFVEYAVNLPWNGASFPGVLAAAAPGPFPAAAPANRVAWAAAVAAVVAGAGGAIGGLDADMTAFFLNNDRLKNAVNAIFATAAAAPAPIRGAPAGGNTIDCRAIAIYRGRNVATALALAPGDEDAAADDFWQNDIRVAVLDRCATLLAEYEAYCRRQIRRGATATPNWGLNAGAPMDLVLDQTAAATAPNPAQPGTDPEQALLTYLGKNGDDPQTVVKGVTVGAADHAVLTAIGKSRFDSAIIRNLWFITNTYRLVRKKMSHDLAQQRTVLQRGDNLVATGMTEYGTDADIGPNERTGQAAYFGERDLSA